MKLTFNDRYHTYMLDGVRCKTISKAAQIPDDRYLIEKWQMRMVLLGAALKPELLERVAAHHDERDKLNELVEEALTVGKAHDAGARGTAVHRITERVDLGQPIIDTELARRVEAAWTEALDLAGLEIIPEYVERIVVYPEPRICGRLDRICRRRIDGQLMVVDLKSGEQAVRYPHSVAIQIAMYANAPLMAGPLPPAGGTTTEFESMPDSLDRDTGIIVHMPAEDRVQVHEIDIAAGWRAAQQLVFPTYKWRAHNNLVTAPTVVVGEGTQPGVPPPPNPQRIDWVTAWIQAIAADKPKLDQLALRWPQGVPTPKQGGWTDSDIDRIAEICGQVDAENGAAFWPPDPTSNDDKEKVK